MIQKNILEISDYTIGPCIEDILQEYPKPLNDELNDLLALETLEMYDDYTLIREY